MIETVCVITAKAKTAIRTNACMSAHLKENRQKLTIFLCTVQPGYKKIVGAG